MDGPAAAAFPSLCSDAPLPTGSRLHSDFPQPDRSSRLTKSVETRDIAEGGVSLPVVFERRIGRSKLLKARPRLEANLIEIVRLAHIEGAQQHRIHYSKDDDIRPNPKHQSD